jgi:MoaA/NifB/PqqE/SkfB family radical SAM enzyme
VEKTSNNQQKLDYTQLFNENFNIGLKQILKFSLRNPGMAWFMAGEIIRFYFADRRRKKWAAQGVNVPPMLIYSVTAECNLDCHGCYAKLLHATKNGEFNAQQFEDVIRQADEVGVSYILVAGGEPFSRPELLDVTASHPGIIFTPFTNGLLVTDEHIRKLKKQKHVLPIVSFEGYELETDERRGQGVYENGFALLEKLRNQGIYYGVSITTTRENLDTISDEAFISRLAKLGCKVFFFINYIPVEKGTEKLVMTQEQFNQLNQSMAQYRRSYEALFLAFPGSELDFGGCLAAGKGFVHINAEGDVEPCPFSPYSDASLKNMSLVDALKSPLLKTIRDAGKRLDESNGVCALWQNREWVKSLVESEYTDINR